MGVCIYIWIYAQAATGRDRDFRMRFPQQINKRNRHPFVLGLLFLVVISVFARPSALLTFSIIALAGSCANSFRVPKR